MTGTEHSFYEPVERLVGSRTGLTFATGMREGLERGIRRAMERAGISEVKRYESALVNDAKLWDDLLAELTVGETYFFREPAQFEVLRSTAIPEILAVRGPGHTLRAWSAGCASGEEAYSLAILFEQLGLGGHARILATDITQAALEKARRATYRAWSLRGEGASWARPFLVERGDDFVVPEVIRRRVEFRPLNLAHEAYPTLATGTWGMDLILCRNVLIYLAPESVRHVAIRLHSSLAEGGWLVTASSDPPLAAEAPFQVVTTEHGIFYRRGPAAPDRPRRDDAPLELTWAAEVKPVPARAVPSPPVDDSPPPIEPSPASNELVVQAREDLALGDYRGAVDRTARLLDLEMGVVLHLRALANLDVSGAEKASAEGVERHPLSSELHYLRAVLLWELGRDSEAAGAVRRAIYLDRSLALAHFFLGSILRRQGDRAGARRSFRNALSLCEARPVDEVVPLSDGEPAGRLAEAARVQISWLDAEKEATG